MINESLKMKFVKKHLLLPGRLEEGKQTLLVLSADQKHAEGSNMKTDSA